MRYRLPALCLLLACSVGFAADPAIRLPVAPVPPSPMPAPVEPGGVLRLTPDVLYVIDSKVDCVVRAHPAGLVKVAKKKGPRDISAKFVDGSGLTEDRTYDGPFVYVVTATGTGRVELDVIPIGLKGEADIVTATVDVDSGAGPIPPPTPKPVEPKVEPVAVKTFRVVLVHESGKTYDGVTNGVLYGADLRAFVKDRCTRDGATPGFRLFDQHEDAANELPGIKALWQAAKPKLTAVPCLIVEVNGKADILPLPANQAAALATLKTYLGEK